MKKLAFANGHIYLINEYHYPICQLLSVLYKLDVTQGTEFTEQLINVVAV